MPRRNIVWILGIAALAVCFSLTGIAKTKKPQDPPWVTKDWTQWTWQDCRWVLNSSPWVHADWSTGGFEVASLSRDVQLRSALPIRQALLRQAQLRKNYDKMNAQKKQAFDLKHASDLSDVADGNILVDIRNLSVMSNWISGDSYGDLLADPSRQATLKLPNGSLVMPIQTKVLKKGEYSNECQYIFPRTVNGKQVITVDDSSFEIVLGVPLVRDRKTKQVVQEPFQNASWGEYFMTDDKTGKIVEKGTIWFGSSLGFKISDMMYKGKLEY
jgi:hypothetical protein